MVGARLLLLVSLAIGLIAVGFAARAHMREQRRALEAQLARTVRLDLRETARRRAARLAAAFSDAPPDALYDARGRLLRPAPPAAVRAWEPPHGTETAVFLRAGRPADALDRARDPHDRAAALLALGVRAGDAGRVRAALAEPPLAGTDLALRARLALARMEGGAPGPDWVDDVSALVDGPSDRVARALLAEAGAAPRSSRARRAELARLRPAPGVRVDGDALHEVRARDDGTLELRVVPLARFAWGDGPIAVALPAPYDALAVRGAVSPARVARLAGEDRARTLLPYALAGLLLLVGSGYALVAIGRAHRLARARADFVANVTHELKTPLANIRLYAETLRENRVRAEDRDGFLRTVLDEAARLDALVEGLLHVARGPRLVFEPLDPARLVADARDRWEPRLRAEGVALHAVPPDGPLPAVRGDRAALERALDNLLDNARKYGGDDARVELSASARDGSVRLAVRDHGPGIPVGDRARLLRPFERLEAGDRKETPGTGLGLSLVVSTMEAHGGRLEIEAAEGGGTRATCVLPAEGGGAR